MEIGCLLLGTLSTLLVDKETVKELSTVAQVRRPKSLHSCPRSLHNHEFGGSRFYSNGHTATNPSHSETQCTARSSPRSMYCILIIERDSRELCR